MLLRHFLPIRDILHKELDIRTVDQIRFVAISLSENSERRFIVGDLELN